MHIQSCLPLLFGLLLPFQVSWGADIVATGSDDLVVVNVAAGRVFINGAATEFDRNETLRIRGGGGDDRVVINGAVASFETVRMEATGFRLLGPAELIFGDNFERIEFRGQAGDACVMVGTGGVDNFKLLPTASQMTTPLATFTANAVERVNVQGQAGADVVDVANPALKHVTCDTDTVRIPGAPGVYPTKHTIVDFERVNTTETVDTFNFFYENFSSGDLLVLRNKLRWSSENLSLFHDGAYDVVNADTFRSVTIRVPEIDGCLFNGEFEGARGDGDPNFVFSDVERRINMRQFIFCNIEVLPGPSTQTSRAFVNDRRFSQDDIAASLETGETTAFYSARPPRRLSVSGFDSTDISRRELDDVIDIQGSSGDDTLIFPFGRRGEFSGNGREIIFGASGVVFNGGSGNDELIVLNGGGTVANTIAASTSEVELGFRTRFLDDAFKTRCRGFEERTIVGDSSDTIFLLTGDGIRISPDRATVNNGGVSTNAIGFGTYYVIAAGSVGGPGFYGNNVVYNNQNDPTLVRQVIRRDFELSNPPRDSFVVSYDFDAFTTARATVAFAYRIFGVAVDDFGNLRVVNP